MMRHSQLRAFHHVALHRGFSRAAEALFLTQPALSEQVRKLEQAHDVLLFTRRRKQVLLTPEGEKLFLLTKRFFEVEEQIEDYMSETRAVAAGTIRIIVDSAHHITDILGKFREKYPKIRVSLRTGNSENVLKALRSYNGEIGIVGSKVSGRDMEMINLGATPIVAVTAKKNLREDTAAAMTLKELAQQPLVFRETGSKTRQKLVEAAAKQGIVLTPAIEAEGREAMREIIVSGAGIGFVSMAEFGNDDRLAPIPLKDVNLEMEETLICLSQRKDMRTIRAFMEFARGHFGRVQPVQGQEISTFSPPRCD